MKKLLLFGSILLISAMELAGQVRYGLGLSYNPYNMGLDYQFWSEVSPSLSLQQWVNDRRYRYHNLEFKFARDLDNTADGSLDYRYWMIGYRVGYFRYLGHREVGDRGAWISGVSTAVGLGKVNYKDPNDGEGNYLEWYYSFIEYQIGYEWQLAPGWIMNSSLGLSYGYNDFGGKLCLRILKGAV